MDWSPVLDNLSSSRTLSSIEISADSICMPSRMHSSLMRTLGIPMGSAPPRPPRDVGAGRPPPGPHERFAWARGRRRSARVAERLVPSGDELLDVLRTPGAQVWPPDVELVGRREVLDV